jgi:hypothetical protein
VRALIVLLLCSFFTGAWASGVAAQTAPSEPEPADAGVAADASTPSPDGATAEPDADAPTDATADSATAPAPKVCVVLVGDPDDPSVAALEELTSLLEASGVVRMPTDPALRRALSGRGEGDGLDAVRGERRSLGLSERRDLPVLVRLGRLSTAVAVVVVRATEGGHEAVILDVRREAFFDGALSLPADVEEVRAFVGRRARAAIRAVDAEPTEPAPRRRPASGETSEPTPSSPEDSEAAAAAALTVAPVEEAPPGDPVLQWFEQNWAYLAAGVLLAGGIAFVVVVATEPGEPQPMLRFVPGE